MNTLQDIRERGAPGPGFPVPLASHPAGMVRPRAASRLVLPAILLGGFALRVYRLGFQELRGDEAFGYFFSLRPVPDIVQSTLALKEPHPVGSYLIEKGWLALAGNTEFALRFASAWFGLLAVALLYRLARRLAFSRPAAGLAAALLAASPYAVWHSQDARMYGMSLALTLASTCLALEALACPRTSRWLAYAGVSWLALHVHYFAAFVLLAQNAWFLGTALLASSQRYRRLLGPWLAAQLLVALLYLPWLLAASGVIAGYAGNGDSPGFAAMLARSFKVFSAGETLPGREGILAAIVAGALLIGGVVRLAQTGAASPSRIGQSRLALLLLYLFLPLLATWAGAASRPIFNERYLIAAAPPFYLFLAAAISGGRSRGDDSGADVPQERLKPSRPAAGKLGAVGAAALLAVLFAAGGLSLFHHYADPAFSKSRGWRDLAAAMRGAAAGLPPSDVRAVENYPDPTLWYYYGDAPLRLTLPPAPGDEPGAARMVAGWQVEGVRRVILPLQPSASWDGRMIAGTALDGAFQLALETPVAGWPLRVYVRPPDALPGRSDAFSGGPTLAGAGFEPGTAVPAGVLAVYLRWEGSATPLPASEKVTIQVLDARNRVVAQADRPYEAAKTAGEVSVYGVALPVALPSGPYRLIVALYDPNRNNLRLRTADGADFIELANAIPARDAQAP